MGSDYNLPYYQSEIRKWTKHNFPNAQPWEPLLGLQEEVGELAHAYLKRHQGIRKNENHDLNIRDAVADIMVYLMNFCNHEGINLQEELFKTWKKVSQRDWQKNPDQVTSNEEIISQSDRVEPTTSEDEKPRFCPKEEWEERKAARERGEFPGQFKFPGHTPEPKLSEDTIKHRNINYKPLSNDHPRDKKIEGDAWL